jgi:uncharacterized protein YebE (UPF0316 family)
MEIILTPAALLGAALIFFLRVADMSLDTLRVLFVMRGRKASAWTLGFFQSVIFLLAIGTVLSNLSNPIHVISYAAGFATGNVIGMMIEEKLAIGHILLSVVSSKRGQAISDKLRDEGYAVTEISARGKDGMVTMLNVSVLRRKVSQVRQMVNEVDESAFITADDIRPIRRGHWRA